MPALTRSYTLPFFRLRVDWPGPAVAERGTQMLVHQGFATEDELGEANARLVFTAAAAIPPLPDDAREVNREYDIRVLRNEAGTIFRCPGLRIDLPRHDARAVGYLAEAERSSQTEFDAHLFLMLSLTVWALLRRTGYYLTHAAAVCRRPEAAILLVAYSGGGKSTLTVHLIRQGWRYVSDDTLLLHSTDQHVDVHPLRRHLGVHPATLNDAPELTEAARPQLTDPGKRSVDAERVFPGRLIERAVPRVLVFPRIVDQPRSTLTPIGPSDALVQLMRQTSFLEAEPDVARTHLELLNTLVRQCTTYALAAGGDLKADPAAAEALLGPLLDDIV